MSDDRRSPRRGLLLGALLLSACGGGGGSASSGGGGPPPASVRIVRDTRGIAHVDADTDAGAYFGAGYAAAEDRLFQMCWERLQYQGRVAEFFGEGSLLPGSEQHRNVFHDIEARSIGWARHARREAELLDPSVRALLDAYAAGVNRVIAKVAAGEPGFPRHPLFAQYGVPLEPWTAADSLGVWYRMARHYAFDAWTEGRNLHNVEALRDQGFSDDAIRAYFFGTVVCDDDAAVVREEDVSAERKDALSAYALAHGLDASANCPGGTIQAHFSQAWAVAGARSETGNAVLVSEPRVQIYQPSAFYEWHMRGATFDVRGIGTPGSPNLLVGGSPHVAWGVTALGLDQSDLYRVQPALSDLGIRIDGVLEPWLVDEHETLRVLGGVDVPIDYRETRFGPLVTPLVFDARPGELYALRALPLAHPERSTTAGFAALYSSATAAVFRERLAGWDYPSANVVFADALGHVGYAAAGAWPVRRPDQFLAGWAAQDGTHAASDWIELLPHDLRPWVLDPSSGVILSANHAPIGAWYPLPQPYNARGDQDRSRRLRELLEGSPGPAALVDEVPPSRLALDAILAPRADKVSPAHRDLVLLGLFAKEVQGHVFTEDAAEALRILRAWSLDGARLDGAQPGCLLASALPTTLRLTDPAAAPLVPQWGGGAAGLAAYCRRKVAGIQAAPPVALDAADLGFLEGELATALHATAALAGPSSNWSSWYRGHVLSGAIPAWTNLEEQDPLVPEVVGWFDLDCADANTLRAAPAACFGFAWQGGAPDATRSLLPFGQSEAEGSTHHADQFVPWTAGELLPAPFTPTALEAHGVERRIELDYP
ncbi:MAG: penicillin acylase family protein [Planctomycetes bacterium]|nr:penicillin acylase family protein [Planctomycetota bacterium]